MTLDLALVSVLDVGEQASLLPFDVSESGKRTLNFKSHDPNIVEVDDNGRLFAQSTGSTTVSVVQTDSHASHRELEITVVPLQEPAPMLHAEHPRLRFRTHDLEQLRNMIDAYRHDPQNVFRPDVNAFFEIADRYVHEEVLVHEWDISGEIRRYELPIPVAQPEPLDQPIGFTDYPFWTGLSRQIERRLTTLSAAWTLSGEKRYADKAREQLLELVSWSKWHEYDKATNNLSLPHFTIAAAIAYDELYEHLTEDERVTIREAMVNLGLRPMSLWFDTHVDHNITVLMNAGMLMGYLAIGDEGPFLDKYYHAPLRELLWYLAQRETSSITEGHTYTSYAIGQILPVAASVRRACGRTDLLQTDYIRDELLDFFIYFKAGAGGYANLSDSRHESDPFSIMLHLFNEFEDPRAAWILSRRNVPLPALVPYLHPNLPVIDPPDLTHPRSRRFDRFDWAALRTGWQDDDTLFAIVSSPSDAGHNHFDQNHFILNIGGEWLITDPGYQNFTPGPEAIFTTKTIGHNGLLVNGEGQSVRGHGRIVSCELGERFDYVVGDATAAYEGRLERWYRHVIFSLNGYILLVDEVRPNRPDDQIDLLFHTQSDVCFDGEAFDIDSVTTQTGGFRFVGTNHSVGLVFEAGGELHVRHKIFPGAERFGTWLSVEPPDAPPISPVTVLQIDPDPTADRFDLNVTRTETSISIEVNHSDETDRHSITFANHPVWIWEESS